MTQNQGAVSTEADGTLVDLLPAEEALFAAFGPGDNEPRPIFIVGAPRTGSTVFYQSVADTFSLPYISNMTNDFFAETPIVGLAIQNGIQVDMGYTSRFGKTKGAFQPSEGSAVMMRWCGGGHPSQFVSAGVLDGQSGHMRRTLRAIEGLTGKPLLTKNAWNCFRIASIANVLPEARFIWIRRDIVVAAQSDLEARYRVQGSPDVWNSATPANVEDLRRLPPTAQVVENQFEFNRAMEKAFNAHAVGRFATVWFEDFSNDSESELKALAKKLGLTLPPAIENHLAPPRRSREIHDGESAEIQAYAEENADRIGQDYYAGVHRH